MNGTGGLLSLIGDPFTIDLRDAFELIAENATTMLNAVAGAIFILMFVIGGIYYITSNGNPQKAESGKKYLTYAVGGLILILLARFIATSIRALGNRISGTDTLASGVWVIINWLLALVGGLAVIFIIIGGIKYITSGGNSDRVNSAKKTLTYAIIGLIAVISAIVVETFIITLISDIF